MDWEDIFCSRPRYRGKDLHDMIDTDSSEPDVRKRMDTADLVYMWPYVSDCGSGSPMVEYGR